jgi:hypothetical protein
MCWIDTTQYLKKFPCCCNTNPSHKNKILPLNQAQKGGKRSPVCWNGTSLGSLKEEHKEKDQVQELNSGPSLAARTRLLHFSRIQSRVVTGLLAGHNTLKRHLYIMGLTDSPARRCGAEETSAHILCECEALATLRHMMGLWPSGCQKLKSGGDLELY